MTSTDSSPKQATRRRASRAAGPTSGGAVETIAVKVDKPTTVATAPAGKPRKAARPPRRPANRRLAAIVALTVGFIASGVLAALVTIMVIQQKHAEAGQERNQRFVDTATQTVINMFSFKQSTVEDTVNRFYSGTSGPLHDMLSQNNNVQNLKSIFHDAGGGSEAVISGAALEGIDGISQNASVIVSARVTMSDQNGNNKPSQPYRMRVIVHEDDNGRMTAYDLKYPNGGN